jgi:hypothetical protein
VTSPFLLLKNNNDPTHCMYAQKQKNGPGNGGERHCGQERGAALLPRPELQKILNFFLRFLIIFLKIFYYFFKTL